MVSHLVLGKLTYNGDLKSGETVNVKNLRTNDDVDVVTAGDGSYITDLDDTGDFPNGYLNNDNIRATWSGHPIDGQVNTALFGTFIHITVWFFQFEETVEGSPTALTFKQIILAAMAEGSPSITALAKILWLTETVEGTPSLATLKQIVFSQTAEGVPLFTFFQKIFWLTETVEGSPTFNLPIKTVAVTEIVQGTPTLTLPFRLWFFTATVEGLSVLCVHGKVVTLTETAEGVPGVAARRYLRLSETVEGTPTFNLPLKTVAFTEIVQASASVILPLRSILLEAIAQGVPFAAIMKYLPFTETVEGSPTVYIQVPADVLVTFSAGQQSYLTGTPLIERHKTLSFTEIVEGSPTGALASKALIFVETVGGSPVLAVPLHPILFSPVLEATHTLTSARILTLSEILEGVPVISRRSFVVPAIVMGSPTVTLPAKLAMLQEILTGIATVATEFKLPVPFRTQIQVGRRNMDLEIERRNLGVAVQTRKIEIKIEMERD